MLSQLLRSVALSRHQSRLLSLSIPLSKGHSKWQNIKDIKGRNDSIRARSITFLLAKAKTAIKQGGFDVKTNLSLSKIQQEFREKGLPLDSFNKFLIKMKNKVDQTIYYELIGPSGSFFIIEVETENLGNANYKMNKCLKQVPGFRLATDLRKRFDDKIVATISTKDVNGKDLSLGEVEEIAIEVDCEEVNELKDDQEELGRCFELRFDLQNIAKLEEELKSKGFVVENIEQRLVPQYKITLPEDENAAVQKLYSLFQEYEDIKNIFDNLE